MTWKLKEHAVPKIQRETNDCVSVPRETKLSFLALPRPLFQVFCMNSKDWHETMRAHGNMLFVSIRTHIRYHWQHGSKFSFDSRNPEFQWISSMSRTTDSRHIYRHCELVACMGTTSGPTAWIDLPFWNLHLGQRIRARTAEQARKEDVKCPAQHHTTIVNTGFFSTWTILKALWIFKVKLHTPFFPFFEVCKEWCLFWIYGGQVKSCKPTPKVNTSSKTCDTTLVCIKLNLHQPKPKMLPCSWCIRPGRAGHCDQSNYAAEDIGSNGSSHSYHSF